MEIYTCPMHPEILEKKESRCPKCGMKLVPKNSTIKVEKDSKKVTEKGMWKNYLPLIIVVGVIFLSALAISYPRFEISLIVRVFMAGFFLSFSTFKLIDLPGFAEGYYTYDLLARRFFVYGYIYPFIELFFGFSMILGWYEQEILWMQFIVMTFSGIGVLIKLLKKERFQCVCLGTFLKVPLTKVTLIEDFGMALLAVYLIFFT